MSTAVPTATHCCECGARLQSHLPTEGRLEAFGASRPSTAASTSFARVTVTSQQTLGGVRSQLCCAHAAASSSRSAQVWGQSHPAFVPVPASVQKPPEGSGYCPTVHMLDGSCAASMPSAFLGRQFERGRNLAGKVRQRDLPPRFSRPRAAVTTALFTGIIEEMGTVRKLCQVDNDGWQLTVEASKVLDGVNLGDSIAVNGTCLTVIRFDSTTFDVGLAPETLRRTSLGEVSAGSLVNLERSLTPHSRMGGHFVQGHVDGTGEITALWPEGDSLWVKVKTSADILRYIVPKGYIAVDGTSLTVVDVSDEESAFTFMLVAYTQTMIVIPQKKVGQLVNLEVDIVGKYVERLVQGYSRENTTALQQS